MFNDAKLLPSFLGEKNSDEWENSLSLATVEYFLNWHVMSLFYFLNFINFCINLPNLRINSVS